jgi:hypothetical protein
MSSHSDTSVCAECSGPYDPGNYEYGDCCAADFERCCSACLTRDLITHRRCACGQVCCLHALSVAHFPCHTCERPICAGGHSECFGNLNCADQ